MENQTWKSDCYRLLPQSEEDINIKNNDCINIKTDCGILLFFMVFFCASVYLFVDKLVRLFFLFLIYFFFFCFCPTHWVYFKVGKYIIKFSSFYLLSSAIEMTIFLLLVDVITSVIVTSGFPVSVWCKNEGSYNDLYLLTFWCQNKCSWPTFCYCLM